MLRFPSRLQKMLTFMRLIEWGTIGLAGQRDSLLLVSDRAPVGKSSKTDPFQTCRDHHGTDLGLGETLFQPGAKAVQSVVAHLIEAAVAVRGKRKVFDLHAQPTAGAGESG